MTGIVDVLKALRELGVAGPGDLVSSTRLPRYRVLSIVRCLEELGLIEAIYAKGSYKVYRVTGAGVKLLESVAAGAELRDIVAGALTSGGIEAPTTVGVTAESEGGAAPA